MTYNPGPDPITHPGASPEDAPHFYVRFNREWRSILLGAVEDAIRYRSAWKGTADDQKDAVSDVDGLLRLLSEDVREMILPQTVVIHPWAWEHVQGTWSRVWNTNAPFQAVVFNTSSAVQDRLEYPLTLQAGEYMTVVGYARLTTGGVGSFMLETEAGIEALFSIATYSAVTVQGQININSFEITEDVSGVLRMVTSDDPTSPGTTGQVAIDWVMFTKIG